MDQQTSTQCGKSYYIVFPSKTNKKDMKLEIHGQTIERTKPDEKSLLIDKIRS